MDAKTCIKKLQYVGVLAFATVDEDGGPQIRNISAVHYEHDPERMYFFTARGKDFCRQLLADGRVQVLGYTKYKEMIRLSAKAFPVPEDQQMKWMDVIFAEQPYLANVYPGRHKRNRNNLRNKKRSNRIFQLRRTSYFPPNLCHGRSKAVGQRI